MLLKTILSTLKKANDAIASKKVILFFSQLQEGIRQTYPAQLILMLLSQMLPVMADPIPTRGQYEIFFPADKELNYSQGTFRYEVNVDKQIPGILDFIREVAKCDARAGIFNSLQLSRNLNTENNNMTIDHVLTYRCEKEYGTQNSIYGGFEVNEIIYNSVPNPDHNTCVAAIFSNFAEQCKKANTHELVEVLMLGWPLVLASIVVLSRAYIALRNHRARIQEAEQLIASSDLSSPPSIPGRGHLPSLAVVTLSANTPQRPLPQRPVDEARFTRLA